MPTPEQSTFLRALPKCEHHIHLEGALTPSLLFELSIKNNIPLPSSTTDPAYTSPTTLLARYNAFTSLSDFLTYYYTAMRVLQTSEDFETLAWDYFKRAASQGVAHAEVFFDPQAHDERQVGYADVVAGIQRACKRAEAELGLTTLVTACFLRHLPPAECLGFFGRQDVHASLESGFVRGIGLDSNERDFPPGLFKDLFDRARKAGLRVTAHAGEEAPAGYIQAALEELKVERVDHGIALIQAPELMAKVVEEKIMLTVCPLSNVVLRCVDRLEDVPIRKFLDAGVRFSINSDDPAYFGGYILENYEKVQDVFQLNIKDWEWIVRSGIEGSWCGQVRKAELLGRLESLVSEWENKF